jgi:hypothetical protein
MITGRLLVFNFVDMCASGSNQMGLMRLFKSFILALVLFPTSADGYRVGDVVDTVLVVDGHQRSTPFRHQMPIFGANWIPYVRFEQSNLIEQRNKVGNNEVRTFSLQFEDGFWVVPAISLTKFHDAQNQSFLDHLTIQFVISKAGTIHAVLMKEATYSSDSNSFFRVTYEWIEEEAVSPNLGLFIMLLLVFLFSVFSTLITCGFIGSDRDHDSTSKSFEISAIGHSLIVPKCD